MAMLFSESNQIFVLWTYSDRNLVPTTFFGIRKEFGISSEFRSEYATKRDTGKAWKFRLEQWIRRMTRSADPGVLKILVILVNDMVIFGTHIPVQVYVKGTITERF